MRSGGTSEEMKVINGLENVTQPFKNPVLTIGNFDGVHLGHQQLFKHVLKRAREINGEAIVMTFYPHPLKVLRPENSGPPVITCHNQKIRLIEQCGIDAVITVNFTKEFAQLSAREFVENILLKKIGLKVIVVGWDYQFGRNREGNIEFLKEEGKRLGFAVEVLDSIKVNGMIVSSTMVRKCVLEGDLKKAEKLLGRKYEIVGEVVKGRDRGGRLLGFPTANIRMDDKLCPQTGVYAVEVVVDGKVYGGAANIGYNPTFGDESLSLETHIFDFSGDLYGKEIVVRLVERLREEKKFSGPEELAKQISIDIEKAKKILSNIQT